MKLPKLTAVIEKEGKWYVATCPELGVASQGRSLEEAEAMIQEAVELLLEEADEAEIKRRLGFVKVRQSGSHIIMRRQLQDRGITVPVPNHTEIARGTLKSIIAQSEIPNAEFMR